MISRNKQSYYEILDVSLNANPEIIRMAYIRAKNAYNRDSLAAYSLFDREESKNILAEIEEAYSILSDSEKRRKYDESHGIVSSEMVYDAYHKGNHAVAAFSRESLASQIGEGFHFEDDPFRKPIEKHLAEARANEEAAAARESAPSSGQPSPIERLRAAQENAVNPKNFQLTPRTFESNPEMEARIASLDNVNGAFLKAVREYKHVTMDEVMNIIKIGKNYLNALESDEIAKLPASVFVRGFVIQYAKALKLDHEKVANAYMEFFRAKRPS
ncbi:MAG: helix-turn-helix domain-containing protein [Bdellovibrionota bacterium]